MESRGMTICSSKCSNFDNYVVCNINSDDVYKIVTPCYVKIENIAPPPPSHTEQIDRPPPSEKSRTRTQSEVTLPLSQQAVEEKVGVTNFETYISGDLPHIPKLTISRDVHPFGIRNSKNHCFVSVILQIIYSVLRTTHQKNI